MNEFGIALGIVIGWLIAFAILFFSGVAQVECSQCGWFNNYHVLKPRECEHCGERIA